MKWVKYFVRTIVLSLLAVLVLPVAIQNDGPGRVIESARERTFETVEQTTRDLTTAQIASLSRSQLVSRRTAVKVWCANPLSDDVRGSGTYVKYKGRYLVITAAHVVSPSFLPPELQSANEISVEPSSGQTFGAEVVYVDKDQDIAILLLPNRLPDMIPVKLDLASPFDVKIGDPIVYTGSPSHHDNLTIFGRVAGNTDGGDFLMHSYAWPGASGAGVFDSRGRLVGVLYGIDMGVGPGGIPTMVEDIVYFTPIWRIAQDLLNTKLEEQGK